MRNSQPLIEVNLFWNSDYPWIYLFAGFDLGLSDLFNTDFY